MTQSLDRYTSALLDSESDLILANVQAIVSTNPEA